MIDLSAEPKEDNIRITGEYLVEAEKINQFLEMEIGITGGEEDGVNNEGVENSSLYTTPGDIWEIYDELSKISRNFTIAAAFGNVHGVYGPGGVSLHPEYLGEHQEKVKKEAKLKDDKPVFLVFHGGSGSQDKEYKTAISYGVVKVVCHALENKRKKERGGAD